MTLFALYQTIYIGTEDSQTCFVGVFATQQDAERVAKKQDIIWPDIRPVTVGEYISPY